MKNDKIIKMIGYIIIFFVYCIPVCFILHISDKEVKNYTEDVDFEFEEKAYGTVVPVIKMDVEEYYTFCADVTSIYENNIVVNNAQLLVFEGDEIVVGDTVAKSEKGDIKSDKNGLVSRIEYEDSKTIIYMYDLENLIYVCKVLPNQLYLFDSECLYDEYRNEIKIIKKSNIMEEGYVNVYLKVPQNVDVYYGQTLEEINLYTGNVYKNSVVVDKNCVYKKDGNWYVREVTAEGDFVQEIEVKVGILSGDNISVTGIDEGIYCDAGYKNLIQEDEDDE